MGPHAQMQIIGLTAKGVFRKAIMTGRINFLMLFFVINDCPRI